MAMRMKEQTGVPMVIDPWHIGGSRENVLRILLESRQYGFDGYMIEAHPNPDVAKTDAKQQLDFQSLATVFSQMS